MNKYEKAVFHACNRRFVAMMKSESLSEEDLISYGRSKKNVSGNLIRAVGEWRKWKRRAQGKPGDVK